MRERVRARIKKEKAMLEIKNLVKVYKTKGGAEVRALDGVSLNFEEKGMVFLLGKSGSGKSTLLNLCGGLDSPDEGEIIIKGRSSKNFDASDFDSYRNTFVGFVFQEYNILNEFSVEDNISIALELQGKNKDKEKVHALLKQVDLEQFARRKPNTLSGGQKQRVAIARALVKDPEIIMADEPTGALDSNTGKQVFDTLKQLSKDKLVIVVSHDREFAEIYGDRIIELKDGKVISDVSKNKIAATKSSENVTFIGSDTISVRKGAKLTENDFAEIKRFISAAETDVIIAGGEKEVADYKKVARIDDNNSRECFKNTDANAIVSKQYKPEDSRFVRSKLPARHAIRIGASSMRVKPFRLVFTIFLSFIAFTLFGLFSTLAFYDAVGVAVESYMQAGYDTLALQKHYRYEYRSYENDVLTYSDIYDSPTKFTPEDLDEYVERYGGAVGIIDNQYSKEISNVSRSKTSEYYNASVFSFAIMPENNTGMWPLETDTDLGNLGDNGVVISSYLYDSIVFYGMLDDNGQSISLQGDNPQEIVGKTIKLGDWEMIVKGVFTMDVPQAYDELKEGPAKDYQLKYEFENLLSSSQYCSLLISGDFYEANKNRFDNSDDGDAYRYDFTRLYVDVTYESAGYDDGTQPPDGKIFLRCSGFVHGGIAPLTGETAAATGGIYYFNSGKTLPSDGEAVISSVCFDDYLSQLGSKYYADVQGQIYSDAYEKAYQQAIAEGKDDVEANRIALQAASDATSQLSMKHDRLRSFISRGYYTYSVYNEESDEYTTERIDATEKDYEEALSYYSRLYEEYGADLPEIGLYFDASGELIKSFKIIGFYYGKYSEYNSGWFMSQSDFDYVKSLTRGDSSGNEYYSEEITKYKCPADAVYSSIVIEFPDKTVLTDIVRGEKNVSEVDDTFYKLSSPVSQSLDRVNGMIDVLSQVFLYVGLVLALFSMLLMLNFISVSITNKKKDIGILRAVGARSADVFKIFYSESAIISGICFVLAVIVSFIMCGVLNNQLAGTLGAAIFVFGPISVLVMFGITLVTSLLATFMPVYSIARKKPVESIRAL